MNTRAPYVSSGISKGLLFVLLTFFLLPPSVAEAAYANGYNYRRLIDFTDAQISAGPHTNFPVLIATTTASLKTTSNGGLVTDTQGDDIIFTGSDGTTQLSHEIEKYDPVTGELVAWVRVPYLEAASTTYMYYGNSSVTTFQGSTPGSVWESNFKGVWHMNNYASTTSAFTDSTSNANNGSGTGGSSLASTTGKISNAYSFDGSNDKVTVADSSTLEPFQKFTISMWFKRNGAQVDWAKLIIKGSNDAPPWCLSYCYQFTSSSDNTISQQTGHIDNNSYSMGTGAIINDVTWYYLTQTHDNSTGSGVIHVNGASVGTLSSGTTALKYDTIGLAIGGKSETGQNFLGSIDEVRVA